MATTTHPSKESVREWLDRRTWSPEPPPSPEEIRHELGWDLIPECRRPGRQKDL
ncbi:hypothetical protein IP91_00110 [Pseudoduganella lurida]|uniref:Uncharacterized protein n=1 Tax=Pseudoduganella lurida TaxID=1036180 RepID=A0A562RIZ5_9BURK|nr:hypothetical protein IP91_00110 [Pseudoduganella lurida]